MRLSEHRYKTISKIGGQLLFVEKIIAARVGEMVTIYSPDGESIEGEVLEINHDTVLVQLYGETRGLDNNQTTVTFNDSVKKVPLSLDMLGRCFNGSCSPVDGLPMFLPEKWMGVSGLPINPAARLPPREFIETGFSAIDGLNTLVKGQKLPIFSCAGLPAKEITTRILAQAGLKDSSKNFAVVFVALGLTFHEYSFYMETIQKMSGGFVAFINMADDPVLERLMTPRLGLTTAEYLAFEKDMDVLVVITDMTNYSDALREISNAREELPGRRGYPGYMYSDLASLYERAGRIKGKSGSITLLPVLTMPEDDITHPIPDLTGYITEGQIVLSRELHRKNVFPPVDVLPSLSRLMQGGIGEKHTRSDHRFVANRLYACYARGRELQKLESIVGRDGMSSKDKILLDFTVAFEREFINQVTGPRQIDQTLDKGIELLERFQID
jgi:V/A-type H+-transporting ATPase subunit B